MIFLFFSNENRALDYAFMLFQMCAKTLQIQKWVGQAPAFLETAWKEVRQLWKVPWSVSTDTKPGDIDLAHHTARPAGMGTMGQGVSG